MITGSLCSFAYHVYVFFLKIYYYISVAYSFTCLLTIQYLLKTIIYLLLLGDCTKLFGSCGEQLLQSQFDYMSHLLEGNLALNDHGQNDCSLSDLQGLQIITV